MRSLKGLSGQAQLSSADTLAYAMANERLMQCDAFHGWRSKRHSVHNVRQKFHLNFFFFDSLPVIAIVSRCSGATLLA